MFQFQTGSIKRSLDDLHYDPQTTFQFQTGSIKRQWCGRSANLPLESFNSKLVRLKGYVKMLDIFYRILTVRVKLFFTDFIFRMDLLSITGCAISPGGWRHSTGRGFNSLFARFWQASVPFSFTNLQGLTADFEGIRQLNCDLFPFNEKSEYPIIEVPTVIQTTNLAKLRQVFSLKSIL